MLKQLLKIADSTLVNLVSKMGTNQDKASHDRFAFFVPKSVYELDNIYQSDWVANKIVNRPTQDMFRKGYYFTGVAGSSLTRLNAELKRLKADTHLAQAVSWARLYGKAYVLLASHDNDDLTKPLNTAKGLSYIKALSVKQLSPTSDYLPASQAGGFFDKPRFYQIQNMENVLGLVHHSRVLVIEWQDGVSVLQKVYDELLRFARVNNNASSLVHESKIDVIRTPDLATQIEMNSDNVFKRFSLVSLMKSNNGMLVLDKEEEYDSKAYSFGGLPELMREFAIQTAGACDIPYTILFGQSPAGMNATGEHDTSNYYDTVASYQSLYLKPLFDDLLDIVCGYLGLTADLHFNPLWQIDEKTLSEVEKNHAERHKIYLELGIITESQIAKQLVEEKTYTVIDDTHIKLLERLNADSITADFDTGDTP